MTESTEFTVHHLRFEAEALTPLALPAHAGPSLRGALWGALQHHFCPYPAGQTPPADHKAICPVCWLMATEKPEHSRGRDIPRPYTIEPLLPEEVGAWQPWQFAPGDRFVFGLTLFARALTLFPYLVIATTLMGRTGIGLPLPENGSRRGRFELRRITALNPLTGEGDTVMAEGETMVHVPEIPVTAADVDAASRALAAQVIDSGRLELCFWTPTRIIERGVLAHRPWLGPLFRRLLERLDALRGEYAAEPPVAEREALVALADGVKLVRDHTSWVEVRSGSRRLNRATPISGFVGAATYQAEPETWSLLLPYLIWGQEIHVGKDATKGDGWYEVRAA